MLPYGVCVCVLRYLFNSSSFCGSHCAQQQLCLSPNFKQCEELVSGIASHWEALAVEAMEAARWIQRAPLTTRGGPWCCVEQLSGQAKMEISAVARMKTLSELFSFAADEHGCLYKHLKDLRYSDEPSSAVKSPTTVIAMKAMKAMKSRTGRSSRSRNPAVVKNKSKPPKTVVEGCVYIRRHRRSGPCGNQSRKNQGVHSKHKRYKQLKSGNKQGAAAVVHNRTHRAKKKAEKRAAESFMSSPLLGRSCIPKTGKREKKRSLPRAHSIH